MKWTAVLPAVAGLLLPASAFAGTGSLDGELYRYVATPGEANVLQQIVGSTQQIGVLDEHVAPSSGAGCVVGALPGGGAPIPSPIPIDEPIPDNSPVDPLPRPIPIPPVDVPELPIARAAGVPSVANEVSCAAPAGQSILGASFELGDLDDALTMNAGAARSLAVDGGTGDDHLDLIYTNQQLTVNGGDGNDSISLDGARSGAAAVDCGPGVDDLVGAPAGASVTGCERVDGRGTAPLTIGHVDAVGSLVEMAVLVPRAGKLTLSDSGKLLRRERVDVLRGQAYVYGLETSGRAADGAATTLRARFKPRRGRAVTATKAITLVDP